MLVLVPKRYPIILKNEKESVLVKPAAVFSRRYRAVLKEEVFRGDGPLFFKGKKYWKSKAGDESSAERLLPAVNAFADKNNGTAILVKCEDARQLILEGMGGRGASHLQQEVFDLSQMGQEDRDNAAKDAAMRLVGIAVKSERKRVRAGRAKVTAAIAQFAGFASQFLAVPALERKFMEKAEICEIAVGRIGNLEIYELALKLPDKLQATLDVFDAAAMMATVTGGLVLLSIIAAQALGKILRDSNHLSAEVFAAFLNYNEK